MGKVTYFANFAMFAKKKELVMDKKITTRELRAQLGETIDAVRLRGDCYTIERRGKPVAALVPVDPDK